MCPISALYLLLSQSSCCVTDAHRLARPARNHSSNAPAWLKLSQSAKGSFTHFYHVSTSIVLTFRVRLGVPWFRSLPWRLPVSGFRFRLGVPCCRSLPWRLPVSGFRFPVSGFGFMSPAAAPCLGGFRFPVFSSFFTIFHIFHHFSSFFHCSPYFPFFSSCFLIFPPFFLIFLHVSTFFSISASGFRFRLGVPCCRSLPWRLPVSGFPFPVL